MSSFTEPLGLEPTGDGFWRTTRVMTFEFGAKNSGLVVMVPEHFETDLGSIPRLLWPVLPPHDPDMAAAFVMHDMMCKWKGFSRIVADAVLYDALRILGVSRSKATLIYAGVSLWRVWKFLRDRGR